jgi:Co/Zn/Cd efflux system component
VSDDCCTVELDAGDREQRRTLAWVLGINLSQVLLAGTVGIVAQSTGLLGAALDNLGDAAVYGVSIWAVGRAVTAKATAARLSGVLLIGRAVLLLAEVLRRFFTGSDPIGWAMIVTALVNAATNVLCLRLLRSHRDAGVHVTASWIFTTNDMIANLGIAVSGVLVMVLDSPLPDLLIGLAVVLFVFRGGWKILGKASDARAESASA